MCDVCIHIHLNQVRNKHNSELQWKQLKAVPNYAGSGFHCSSMLRLFFYVFTCRPQHILSKHKLCLYFHFDPILWKSYNGFIHYLYFRFPVVCWIFKIGYDLAIGLVLPFVFFQISMWRFFKKVKKGCLCQL